MPSEGKKPLVQQTISAAASPPADGEPEGEDAAAERFTDEQTSLRKGGRHDTIVFVLAAWGKIL